MKPVHCIIKHDPENGTYGDCVRACVASVLELPAMEVPHFYEDNCDGETGYARIREWLAGRNLAPFFVYFNGSDPLETVLEHMTVANPEAHYILYGNSGEGDHVVVCQGGKVVHDPAWIADGIAGPNSNGFWVVMVIAVA